MINQETQLPYAKFDHSDTRIRQAQYRHKPSWQGAWIYCLKYNDEESAHLIRLRNDERYAEQCEAEAASVLPVKGSELKSLTEAQSERDAEAA